MFARRVLVWSALILSLCVAGRAHAAPTFTVPTGEIELRDLTTLVSQATGRTILYGQEFKGDVVIESPKKKATADELWQIYLSALAKSGWGVVLHGKVARIAPRKDLATEGGPVVIGPEGVPPDESEVTATFDLNNLDPSDAAMRLAPLVGPEGRIVPLPSQGRIVVSASAANVEKVRELLTKLDQKERRGDLEVVRLRRADAATVAEILVRVFSTYYIDGGRFAKRDAVGGLIVVPEPRSGSLVIRGDRRDVEAATKLAQRLDQAEDPVILIRDLDNADAAGLAARLQELLKGRKP